MSEIHPAAEAWPMLPEPDLRRLAADIKKNGLQFPIVLDPAGLVLDGRNRLAACKIAGVEPDFENYSGDPVAYVLSANNEVVFQASLVTSESLSTRLTLPSAGQYTIGVFRIDLLPPASPEATAFQITGTLNP